MKKVSGLIGFALALMLSTYSNVTIAKEPKDYDSAYSKVTFTTDQYQGTRTYKSTAITLKNVKWNDPDFLMGQLSLTKSSKQELYCLLTLYHGENWSFFEKVFDSNQQELQLVKGTNRVGSLGYSVNVTEQGCIAMDRSYLEKAALEGLDMKLVGQNRNIIIKVQPFFVKAFLDAVDYSERTRFASQ